MSYRLTAYDIMNVLFLPDEVKDEDRHNYLMRLESLTYKRQYTEYNGWRFIIIARPVEKSSDVVNDRIKIRVTGIFINTKDRCIKESKLAESESTVDNGFDINALWHGCMDSARQHIDTYSCD